MMAYVDINFTQFAKGGQMIFVIPTVCVESKNFQRDAKEGNLITIFADDHRGMGRLYPVPGGWMVSVEDFYEISQDEFDSLMEMYGCFLKS